MNENEVRQITKKFLDEEHLLGFVKIFEKEHNLFRGSHDKIGLPESLVIHQTTVNQIIDKIEDEAITLDQIGDGEAYGRIVLSALSEGLVLLSEAAGNLDNIANGETYGKVLFADLSGGHILLGTTEGDLDDVDDGETYGKILLTDISAGHILLVSAEGDLDDVDDGEAYGKVALTSISAGKIVVAGFDADALARIFTDGDAKVDMEAWRHVSDATLIDGGKIYTQSITAAQILAGVISADKINVGDFIYLPSDEGLIGYWSLDEGSGALAVDGSGNGNNGSLENMTEADWVAGVSGQCLDFDGGNDYVKSLDVDALDGNGEHKTISAWIYHRETNNERIVSVFQEEGSSLPQYSFFIATGGVKIRIQFVNDADEFFGDITSTMTFTLNEWHHIAFTYDEAHLIFYIDGVPESHELTGEIRTDPTPALYIGARGDLGGDEHFNGLIDEVRIYNRALTASEISALYLYPAGNKATVISGVQIADDTITAAKIVARTITADEIFAGTITADEIKVSGITMDRLATSLSENFDGFPTDETINGKGVYDRYGTWTTDHGGTGCTAEVVVESGEDKILRLTDSANINSWASAYLQAGAGYELIIATLKVELRQSVTNRKSFMFLYAGAGVRMQIIFDSDGNIKLFDGAATTTLQAYSADTWYTIKVYWDCCGGGVVVSVDGAPKTRKAMGGTINYINRIGFITSTTAESYTFDVNNLEISNLDN